MKLFISADIEGVSGVVHMEHTMRDGREHDRARMLMTEEVNAAIRGALDAGATEIVVNDSHGTMRNIIPESLLPEAELIIGSPKRLSMMQGIDETFDAALFVGYHTQAGENGILSHSYDSRVVKGITINGVKYGELGVNSLIAGHFNVPVVMVSGCQLLALEAKALSPNIETAIVKKSVFRTTAQNLHPARAQEIIREKAAAGIRKRSEIEPFAIKAPFHVEVEFLQPGLADAADISPLVARTSPSSITFTANEIMACYQMLRVVISMAGSALS
ncbi:peptidase M55 D-aminopeptidase [Neobacillus bataviensis LMG 21833]|uniref:Peptidase M55 D-aminopeptidase n=2 Tax=Neobacillus bataviensis TaxID=220685 RepID=K6EDV5_9BACI|nr:peptidase M55 D-aminopeptidase [Neobacillus bataviensis LMG 21833]